MDSIVAEDWDKKYLEEMKPKMRAHWATELARISLQLERAPVLPLIVTFGNTEAADSEYQPVMDFIAKQHSRWREVAIRLSPAGLHRLSQLCEAWSFDKLRQMTLALAICSPNSEMGEPNGDPVADMFEHSPKLNNLALIGASLGALNFRWGQLTTFTLESVHVKADDIRNILSQTSSLEVLTLDCTPIQHGPITGPLIFLRHLKNFNFRTNHVPNEPIEEDNLFSFLRLPSLTHLSLRVSFRDLRSAKACITSGQWSHELVSLRVHEYLHQGAQWEPWLSVEGIGFGTLAIVEVLEHLTALRSLCFIFPSYYKVISTKLTDLDVLLNALQPPERMSDGRPGLCPNLESLELASVSLSWQTPDLLLKTLAPRVSNSGPSAQANHDIAPIAPYPIRSTIKCCLREVVLVAHRPLSPGEIDPQLFSGPQSAELSRITSGILFHFKVGEFWPPASVETLKKLAKMRQVVDS